MGRPQILPSVVERDVWFSAGGTPLAPISGAKISVGDGFQQRQGLIRAEWSGATLPFLAHEYSSIMIAEVFPFARPKAGGLVTASVYVPVLTLDNGSFRPHWRLGKCRHPPRRGALSPAIGVRE